MLANLFRFKGGLTLDYHKQMSTQTPTQPAPIPHKIVLPLRQHIGTPAEPIVNVGDQVLKGQKIAKANDYVSAPIHASTSGTITAIEPHIVAHPSGLSAPCITIAPDQQDRWITLSNHAKDYRELSASALRNVIREAGIVGLGGAGFPSFIKLNPGPGQQVETLILNGAECEPYITCDDRLMRERPEEIVAGLMILRHALQAKSCVIAIENNKPEALAAITAAVAPFTDDGIQVIAIPTLYPAGGERQLVKTITNKEVPQNGLPIHIGVVCQNVGTTAAIYRAINHGEPLISRYVTLTGDINQPCNFEVLLGTPIDALLSYAQQDIDQVDRIIMGGPMMGFALHSAAIPVVKTTNCVLITNKHSATFKHKSYSMPCIRCGQCADVCPAHLLPQQLYWHTQAHNFDTLQNFNLFDCIECGCCDYVCPSKIPLVQHYRYAKDEIWKRERETRKSDIARERFEFRQQRLEREKAEREARQRQRKAELQGKLPTSDETTADKPATDPKKAAILAALERVKNKETTQPVTKQNIDNLTTEQQTLITEVDTRRAKQREQEAQAHASPTPISTKPPTDSN